MSYARNKRRKAINRRNNAHQKTKTIKKGASVVATGKPPDAKIRRTPRLYLPQR